MILFLFVYFGIRSYRDNVLDGRITFGRAFGVGLLITLISCVCHVPAWEVVYFKFMPDFPAKHSAYLTEHLKASGASEAAITAAMNQGDAMKLYDDPIANAAVTFTEPFPIGLIVTLISAAGLRRKTANA